MSPGIFYVGTAVLVALSGVLVKQTSPYSRVGGYEYEKRMTRRLLGKILLVMAPLSLAIGVLAQFSSNGQ